MSVVFFIADYNNPDDASVLVDLLDDYAQDAMGGGEPLSAFTRDNLAEALRNTPGAFSVIGTLDGRPVALANCFQTLSTFACQPLINIHDLMVTGDVRGQGISQGLLAYIESHARNMRCCKVTLEVLEGNSVARSAYTKFGFEPYTLDEHTGSALFMQKSLIAAG